MIFITYVYLILLTAIILPAFLNIILLTAPKFPLPISPQSTRSSEEKSYSASGSFKRPVDCT